MSVQSTIESLLKLKPISREFAESVARQMDMSIDPATGVVTGPQVLGDGAAETRVGDYVVLCFEFNFMDERRERLAATSRPTFKIGDRVSTPHGPDGTITSIGEMVRVTLDETSWVYDFTNLQHIPPAKFKIGDMVVTSDPRFVGRCFYVAVVNRNTIGVSVRPDDHHGYTFSADDLALVPAVEP